MMARAKEKTYFPSRDSIIVDGCSLEYNTKKEFSRLLKTEKNPNLIINVVGTKCDVEVNPEIYTKDDKRKINRIIKGMSEDIWIDKTYVNFKGNRFKDNFMKEDGWNEMMKLLISSDFGRKSKKANSEIISLLMTIVSVYLYGIAEKFGYDCENIDIQIKDNSEFYTCYFIDKRKEWKS